MLRSIYDREVLAIILIIVLVLAVLELFGIFTQANAPSMTNNGVLSYTFNSTGTLYETGAMGDSSSPYWWVNSGAELIIKDGTGSTIAGALPADDPWRLAYFRNNPVDTDNGFHPQNIFRLVTKSQWLNYTLQAYFKIDTVNASKSPNRNGSNGLLLFNRYADEYNLYYAGIRVDGTSVIKKKAGGIYYTMAQNQIFPGTYDPTSTPNLIPTSTWIGLRTVVMTTEENHVHIQLYMDQGDTGDWKLIAEAEDDGSQYGGAAFLKPGYTGIRTDFMDVEFKDYTASKM